MASPDSRRFADSRYPNPGSSKGRRISNADNYRSRGDGYWSAEASPRDGDISMSDAPPRWRDERAYDNYRSGDREYDGYRSADRRDRDDRRYDQRDDRELFPKRGESDAREDLRPGSKRDSIANIQNSPAPSRNSPLVVATSSPVILSQPTSSTATTTPILTPITIPPLSLVSAISAQAPQNQTSKLASQNDITGMISETAYIYWKFREAAQQYDRAEADVRSREEYFKGFPLMQERYQLKIKTATHELQEAKKEWNLRQDNLERGMRNAVKLETERLIEGNLRKVEKYVREVLEAHINSASSRTLISPAEIEILKRDIQALKQQPAMPIIPSSELKELRRELDQLKQRDEQREKQMQELTKQAEARYGKVEAQAKIAQTTQNQIREELDAVKSALQELKKDMPGMQKQIGLNTETINEHKKLQLKVEGLESQHRKTAETVTAVNITFKAIQNQQNQLVAQHDGTQKALENIKKNQTLFIGRQDKIEEQSTATKKAAAAMAEKQEAFNKQVLELKQKQDEFDKRASQISARIDSTPAPVASPPIVTSSFNPSDLAPIIARLKDHIDEITETTLNGVETRFAEITAQISSLNISHTDTATALSTLDGKVNNVFARLQPFINHINGVQISINTLKSQCESLGMGLKHCDDKLSENSTKEFAEKIATLMQQRFPNWFEVGKQIQYLLSSYRAHEAKLTQQLATISQLLNEQNNAKQMQSQLQTETTMLKNLQAQLQNSHAQVIHKVKQLAAERAERQQLANTANDTTNNGASGTNGNNGNVSSNINSAQVTPSPPTPAPACTLQLTNGANETEAKISRIETEIQQNTTALATLDETFNVFRTDMREFYDGVYAKLEEYYRAIKHLEAQQHSIVTWVEGGSEGAPPIVRTENPEEPTEQVPANNQNSRDGTEEGEIRDEEMQGTVGTNE